MQLPAIELAGDRLRADALRHGYCAARLQSLDAGAPVAIYTVRRETGHAGTSMVERVYAKLGKIRVRTERVSFYLPDDTNRDTRLKAGT
jgi:integrase